MRLRIKELLAETGLTPYHLAKRSKGRISLSTAYRLTRLDGRVEAISMEVLDALCDVFGVGPERLFKR